MTTTRTEAASIARMVTTYRAVIARNPLADLAGNSDVAMWLVTDTFGRDWSHSELAKALGITTPEARGILADLTNTNDVRSTNRGARSRYSAAR